MRKNTWYVRFVDGEGYEDFVSGRKASCENEAIRLAKQYLVESGCMSADQIAHCSAWTAEKEND